MPLFIYIQSFSVTAESETEMKASFVLRGRIYIYLYALPENKLCSESLLILSHLFETWNAFSHK